MIDRGLSRREMLGGAAAMITGLAAAEDKPDPPAGGSFAYMLNTSTIREQKLSLPEEIDLAARAGYQALEPWVSELDQYAKGGGSLKDLGKRVRDAGLTIESAIAFTEWVVDDDDRRKKAVEETKRQMDLVQQIGGTRIAAPPAGATKQEDLNLLKAADRYREIAEAGERIGVTPQVEVWGFSKSLSRLGEAVLVAVESGCPKACVLADVFHLYKGGSGFKGIPLVGPALLHVFHFNDYPAEPPRGLITDAARVYPGDGVAPLKELLCDLDAVGFRGFLSLELFNPEYWKKDAFLVAKTGLEKMKALVAAARGGKP
jgi:sugar phosphate isomerase/epimerase